ncbi:MAG: hypothetical protein JW741_01585 [Sedimentisphaerales bacterium]|nr:hypothetical protein [Sedimentisphaerales bacterium]
MGYQGRYTQVDPEAEASLRRLLEKLNEELNPAEHRGIREHFMRAMTWQAVERPPLRLLFQELLERIDEKSSNMYPVREAVNDPAKLLVNELWYGRASAMGWLEVRDDQPLQVRVNLGIGLVASTFGSELYVVENNPPWVAPLTKDKEAIPRAIEKALDEYDVEDAMNRGWIPKAAEMHDYYKEILAEYPNVERSVAVALPDLQGPFTTAEYLWGSDLYLAMYTHGELVDRLLEALAKAQVRLHGYFRENWIGRELLPEGFSHQHGLMVRGNILIRCDGNIMISPKMYRERVLPWDMYVAKNAGGGSFHSCGKWDHNVRAVIESGVFGTIDFGMNQSRLHDDMDGYYRLAKERRIHFNQVDTAEEEILSGDITKRFPTGVTLQHSTKGIASARRLVEAYREHVVEAGGA